MLASRELEALFKSRFSGYTSIQKKAIPHILSGSDVLITAPTGTGKTEAAFLPFLDMMCAGSTTPITLLYITPLRSLNRDMVSRLRGWAEALGFRVAVRHGDTSQKERAFQSKHPAHIFITTPETLQIMLGVESFRSHLRNLKYVIVDELHELVSGKRGAQLSLGITRLRSIVGFQTVAISATLKDYKKASSFVLREGSIVVRDTESPPPEISIVMAEGRNEREKLDFMCRRIMAVMSNDKVLVFANTRYMAELVGSRLIADGLNVAVHHGSLSREEREEVEAWFKKGRIKGLVCTSSLELGIDVGDVSLVVQLGSPKQVIKALQRIGRAGHALGKPSRGIIICHNRFDYQEAQAISARAGMFDIEDDTFIYPALDVLAHSIAGELLVLREMSVKALHRITIQNQIYSGIGEEEILEVVSEMHRNNVVFYNGVSVRSTGKTREYYFTRASTIPSSAKHTLVCGGRAIGTLDERFVLSLAEGDVFIMRGTPWLVLSIEDGKVIVEQSRSYVLAIPEWEGEQIPVRREIAEMVGGRIDLGVRGRGVQSKKLEKEKVYGGAASPQFRDLIVDVFADYVIIYTFLGSTANNALALALAGRLRGRFSAEVSVKSSPYAVFLRVPYPLSEGEFRDAFSGLNVMNEVKSTIHKNTVFSHIFSHIGYYMGMSSSMEHYSPYYIAKLSASVPYKEAFRYFLHRHCDTGPAQTLADAVSSRGMEIIFRVNRQLPDAARDVLDHMSGSQVLFPDIPEGAALALLGRTPETYRFLCTNCSHTFYGHVSSLPKKCIRCSSVLIAPVPEKHKKSLEKGELMRRAALYGSYGKRALLALSTYGVGTETAARILARMHKDDTSLALDLLRAREQFIRTKKYWSPN